MTIRDCVQSDFHTILAVINDSALAYRGVIPADCWHDPYMSAGELRREMKDGVTFRCMELDADIIGVMGFQDKGEVALIRHAYVRTPFRGRSVGTKLLKDIETAIRQPILIGTWAAATWAISFYEKNGYARVAERQKNELLRKYWSISDRQIDASVVLADAKWVTAHVPRHGPSF